jgi:hypothetical protein
MPGSHGIKIVRCGSKWSLTKQIFTMRGNSTQYQPSQYQQSLRSPTSMSDSRTGRASPGLGNSMPEARPASYPQRPYSPQRPTQYDTAPYTKPGVDYGRPPVPSSYSTSTPTSAFSSDSIITTTTTTGRKNAWIEEARESTANFKKNGSPLPLVWVRVLSPKVDVGGR